MRGAAVGLILLAACSSTDPGKLAQRARAQEREGDMEGALQSYREAIALKPDEVTLHRDYQNLMRRMKRTADVRAEYKEKAERHPASPMWQYLYARLMDGPALEEGMKKVLVLDANYLWAHHALAFYYKNQDRYEEALREFEWVLGRVPNPPAEVAVSAAICYERIGRPREAEELLKRAKDVEPGSPLPYFYSGLLSLNARKYDAAARDLEACLQRAPNFSQAFSPLAQAYHAMGDFEKGRGVRDRARKYYEQSRDDEFAADYLVHVQRWGGWILKSWERLTVDVDLKMEPGNVWFVTEVVRLDPPGVRVRYKLQRTADLTYLWIREVKDADGKPLEPAQTDRWADAPSYAVFYRSVVRDFEPLRDRYK